MGYIHGVVPHTSVHTGGGKREEGRKVYIRGVVPHTSVHAGRERGRKEGREEGMERTGDDKQRNKTREAPLHTMCFETVAHLTVLVALFPRGFLP